MVAAALAGAVAGGLLVHYAGSSRSSGIAGSGVAGQQTRQVAPFRGVELSGANEVVVTAGRRRSVVVSGDSNLLGRVTTAVHDGRLVIGNRGSFTTKSPMRVSVTVPTLDALALTGSGVLAASGISGTSLTVTLAGSGLLRASGSVDRLTVSLGGSGDAQLEQLVARDAHADVSGSGRIVVHATRSLDASVPGSGVILYSGDPAHVSTSVTGSGAVTRG